jgi:mannose/fructose-specific phosphotransferase system component IIA
MADLNSALASNVDLDMVHKNNERVESLTAVVREMVKGIVDEVCKDLDAYMTQIDEILRDTDNPVSDEELEDFTLNLPCLLYLVSARREALKVKEDVAKAVHKDVYNRVREKAQGTVADKDTAADLAAQSEAITVIVLQRAGSTIKTREEAAWEMLNSVKKVLTRRTAELELTRQTGG